MENQSIVRLLLDACIDSIRVFFMLIFLLFDRSTTVPPPFPSFPVDRAPHLLSIEHLRWPENALQLSAFTVSIRFSPATMFCLRNYRKYRKNSYETTVKNARRKLGNWIEWNGMLNDKIVGVIESKRRRGGR